MQELKQRVLWLLQRIMGMLSGSKSEILYCVSEEDYRLLKSAAAFDSVLLNTYLLGVGVGFLKEYKTFLKADRKSRGSCKIGEIENIVEYFEQQQRKQCDGNGIQ